VNRNPLSELYDLFTRPRKAPDPPEVLGFFAGCGICALFGAFVMAVCMLLIWRVSL